MVLLRYSLVSVNPRGAPALRANGPSQLLRRHGCQGTRLVTELGAAIYLVRLRQWREDPAASVSPMSGYRAEQHRSGSGPIIEHGTEADDASNDPALGRQPSELPRHSRRTPRAAAPGIRNRIHAASTRSNAQAYRATEHRAAAEPVQPSETTHPPSQPLSTAGPAPDGLGCEPVGETNGGTGHPVKGRVSGQSGSARAGRAPVRPLQAVGDRVDSLRSLSPRKSPWRRAGRAGSPQRGRRPACCRRSHSYPPPRTW